jgi:hypothetical protein
MRFRVEIEARLANFELWIPSTLVFLLSLKNTLSRRCLSIHLSEIVVGLFDRRRIRSVEANTSMFGI